MTRFVAVLTVCGALAVVNGSGCSFRSLGSAGRDGDVAVGVDGPRVGDAGTQAAPTDAPGDGPSIDESSPGLPQGAVCLGASDCISGNCVEGVCCDEACDRPCFSCRNALTASSPDGTCAAVASGKDDVRGRCGTASDATSCGNIGHCDGKGACARYGSTTVCAAPTCTSGSFTPAGTCDGAGNCSMPAAESCRGFTCTAAGGCASTCSSDAECTGGYCAPGGTCSVRKIDGLACAASNECVHGNCVDGVCCDGPCADSCQSCNAGTPGRCQAITGAPRPGHPACTGTGPCAGTCDGTSRGCSYPDSGTVCAPASCSSNSAVLTASTCNGMGSCTPPSTTVCAGGTTCSGGACVPRLDSGAACQTSDQCASRNCSSGVCCLGGQTACGGACFDLTNTRTHCGSCTNVCSEGSQVCSSGRCLLTDGQACTIDATCASGTCTPYFVDADGDTYGATITARFCGITPPANHSAMSGDCCDSSALIHPGADFQTVSAAVCGITWDYNCNGAIDKSHTQCNDCTGAPVCRCTSAPHPDASCGRDVAITYCTTAGMNCISGGVTGRLGCR